MFSRLLSCSGLRPLCSWHQRLQVKGPYCTYALLCLSFSQLEEEHLVGALLSIVHMLIVRVRSMMCLLSEAFNDLPEGEMPAGEASMKAVPCYLLAGGRQMERAFKLKGRALPGLPSRLFHLPLHSKGLLRRKPGCPSALPAFSQ